MLAQCWSSTPSHRVMILSILTTLVGILVAYLVIVAVHYKVKSDRYGRIIHRIVEDKKTVLADEIAEDLKEMSI